MARQGRAKRSNHRKNYRHELAEQIRLYIKLRINGCTDLAKEVVMTNKSKIRMILSVFLTILMCTAMFAGCSSDPSLTNVLLQNDEQRSGDQTQSTDDNAAETNNGQPQTPNDDIPTVYMTTDISPEGLMAVYNALGANPTGRVAVKITTGEPPNSNYLRPELMKDLVQSLDGTLVESNTAYGGRRASNAMHLQVAKDHGFTDIAVFDLQDADGEISLPVVGGVVLTENFVGVNFPNYDYYVILSHFKGHASAGYGGAIKNLSIGIASASGKSWIHSGGTRRSGFSGNQDNFLKSMAEASKSVVGYLDGNILYINVMNRLSVDCDCNGNPREPDMHDIGILASFDPVALDQACLDLVYASEDGASLIQRIESRNGVHTIEHAEAIGLGSRMYNLVNID
jgi:uncharacterized Fe-S center protein